MNALLAQNMSALRAKRRLSMKDVASQLGISYQQLQKYEKNVNRISAARLYHLSKILNVDMHAFFTSPN